MVRVLLFGRLADQAGWRERTFAVDAAARVSDLAALIGAEDTGLAAALAGVGVRAAVDKVIVKGDAAVSPNAEVAFMPPMSGG